MSVTLIEKQHSPLLIKVLINESVNNEPGLFIWEDSLSKNIKYVDAVSPVSYTHLTLPTKA